MSLPQYPNAAQGSSARAHVSRVSINGAIELMARSVRQASC